MDPPLPLAGSLPLAYVAAISIVDHLYPRICLTQSYLLWNQRYDAAGLTDQLQFRLQNFLYTGKNIDGPVTKAKIQLFLNTDFEANSIV